MSEIQRLKEESDIELTAEDSKDPGAGLKDLDTAGRASWTPAFQRLSSPDLPYRSEMEYLDDAFGLLISRLVLFGKIDPELTSDDLSTWKMRHAALEPGVRRRLELSSRKGFIPRYHQLCTRLLLNQFECDVLLFMAGTMIYSTFGEITDTCRSNCFAVDTLIRLFCDSGEDMLKARQSFTRKAPLMGNHVLCALFSDDDGLFGGGVSLHCASLEYLTSMKIRQEEFTPFGKLITPSIRFSQIVLPAEKKKRLLRLVRIHSRYAETMSRLYSDSVLPYGRAQVLLFHGPAGTGKTATAHALACELGKPLMLGNVSMVCNSMFNNHEVLQNMFREAFLNSAVLFLDESEELLSDMSLRSVLLQELEHFEGVVVLAANRPEGIDEALSRRISLMLSFEPPNERCRRKIWDLLLPKDTPVDPDVDTAILARKFDFSGGRIKNAVCAAIGIALQRKGRLTLRMKDLVQASMQQLQNQAGSELSQSGISVPRFGLEKLILSGSELSALRSIVCLSGSVRSLESSFGFGSDYPHAKGVRVLFHGDPGTGKTLAAEALAHELGRNLMQVNPAEIESRWVGQTQKNLVELFQLAKNTGCVLFFDEADSFFAGRTEVRNSTDRYANQDVNMLLSLM
ncbi:MAG: AAA family ATPase, partial [Candidatus Wallbacteria bacterium]|nr:AAA family ATPase [Candidatus Wallbacteria bacterium]